MWNILYQIVKLLGGNVTEEQEKKSKNLHADIFIFL